MKAFTSLRKKYPDMFDATMMHDLQNDIYLVSRKDPISGHVLLMAYNPHDKTTEVSYERVIEDKYDSYSMIKGCTNGKMKINLNKKKIIVPGNEAVVLIFK